MTIHYAENNGYYQPYCGASSRMIALPKMKLVTCKKCLAKIKKDEVVK